MPRPMIAELLTPGRVDQRQSAWASILVTEEASQSLRSQPSQRIRFSGQNRAIQATERVSWQNRGPDWRSRVGCSTHGVRD